MLPYNSTLDDVPSEQAWNKGYSCNRRAYALPLFVGKREDVDDLPDNRQAWETHKSTITTQEACYTECQTFFKLQRSANIWESAKLKRVSGDVDESDLTNDNDLQEKYGIERE